MQLTQLFGIALPREQREKTRHRNNKEKYRAGNEGRGVCHRKKSGQAKRNGWQSVDVSSQAESTAQ